MRSRRTCLVLSVLTIAVGLASRKYPNAFPTFFATYAGDALWAALVYWLLATLFPGRPPITLALTALAISFIVEISQLYHPHWLEVARGTPLGALVLGKGFLWSDLVCYVAGVAGAALTDTLLVRRLYTAGQ